MTGTISREKRSRRHFLRHAVLGPLALGAVRQLSSAEPHIEFPIEPRERLAVSSYPFRAFIDAPGNHVRNPEKAMPLTDFARVMAARFGIHNVVPLAAHFRSSDAAYVHELRNSVEEAGSHISDLGLSGRSFYHPDPARRKEATDYGKQWIDIAVTLGSPSVRQHLSGAPGVSADVNLAAESLGELAAYGEKKSVVVNLENDSPVSEDPFFLVAVMEKVRSPYLRGIPDFANSMTPDNDVERNKKGVAAMFRHAFNICHVKDAYTGRDRQVHTVELAPLFDIAKQSGFRGYYMMEVDTPGDPYELTERLVQKTMQYIS